ncbi:MAG: long-chain acyl-CoA synthetase, partial [Alphaproteobacteria bacterium]
MIALRISPDWTVQNLLDAMATRGPAPAVVTFVDDQVTSTSYAELAECARRLASGLLEAGVKPGAAIGIYAPNSVAWLVVRLAVGAVGAVTVAVDDLIGDAEAAGLLTDSDCRWLFTTSAHAHYLAEIAPALDAEIFTLDDALIGAETGCGWRDLLAETTVTLPPLAPSAPTALIFTSGTTGAPKAFTLSHANLGANVRALVAERLIDSSDRVLLPLPLHHVYPFVVGMLTTLATGAVLVLPEAITGPSIVHALRAG